MTIKFAAQDIHTEKTDDHILIGFADSAADVQEFIVVMRIKRAQSQAPDDIVGKPYFEYCDETAAGYGCIRAVTLRSAKVTFKIDTAECPDIPDREFVVDLSVDQPRLMEIADHLTDILDDAAPLKIIGD